jgi:3'-phosphoadenosine 5'-phosphosulfate sulfotransferase (PAPS reductase)/FAD synthetase
MEYKYTGEDLKAMQNWSFETKILKSQAKIIETYQHYGGNVCVNFSGGNDSSVLIDLARRAFPDIPAVFCDTGIEYPDILGIVKSYPNVDIVRPYLCGKDKCVNCIDGCFGKAVRTVGWNFPSKDTALALYYARKGSNWAIKSFQGLNNDGTESEYRKNHYYKWAYLIESHFVFSDKCCKLLKESVLDKYHKETKTVPILGITAGESFRRKQSWYKTGCNAFDTEKPQSKPLSFWLQTDILRYIKEFNIPYAKNLYGEIVQDKNGNYTTTKMKQTGCSLCPTGCHLDKPNKYQSIIPQYPDLWAKAERLGLFEMLDYIGVPYGGEQNGKDI